MGNKVGLGLGNGEKEKSGNKSRGKIEIVIMCDIFISPLCIFLCLRILLEIVNTIILKCSNAYLLVNFETILWIAKKRVVFKIDLNKNNCDCFLTLLRL